MARNVMKANARTATIAIIAILFFAGCPVQMVTVPYVHGLTRSAAETGLTNAGLTLGTVSEEYSDAVAAGLVILQDPEAGITAVLGSALNLTISKGAQEAVADPQLSDSIMEFLDETVPIEQALEGTESRLKELIAQGQFDVAMKSFDEMLLSTLETPEGAELLFRRSTEGGGRVVELDLNFDSNGNKQDPKCEEETGPAFCLPKTTIIFVNGMNTNQLEFYSDWGALAQALIATLPPCGAYKVKGEYNVSATDKYRSLSGVMCSFADIVPTYTPLNMACYFRLPGIVIDFTEALLQAVAEWGPYPAKLITDNDPFIIADIARLQESIEEEVLRGRTVVVVAHSQGNFFAQEAIERLGEDENGFLSDSVGVIPVGSPIEVRITGFPMERVSMKRDIVARVAYPFGEEPSYGPDGIVGLEYHDFISAYLGNSDSKDAILNSIFEFHSSLDNVRGRGTLSLSESSVGLGPDRKLATVTFSNVGEGVLRWSVASVPLPKILVTPASGKIAEGDTQDVVVSYVALNPELNFPYSESIPIRTCGAPEVSTDLLVTVREAKLKVSNQSVQLFAGAPSSLVLVTNENPDVSTLRWTTTSSDDRVIVSPLSFTGNETDVEISVPDPFEEINATVTFSNTDNPANTVEVAVHLRSVPNSVAINFQDTTGLRSEPYSDGTRWLVDSEESQPWLEWGVVFTAGSYIFSSGGEYEMWTSRVTFAPSAKLIRFHRPGLENFCNPGATELYVTIVFSDGSSEGFQICEVGRDYEYSSDMFNGRRVSVITFQKISTNYYYMAWMDSLTVER